MATYTSGGGVDITLSASGNQDTNQYKFVIMAGTAHQFEVATGASGPAPIGILQNDPQSGNAGQIRVAGVSQIWMDAATSVGVGDFVTCGSDGAGVVAATAGSNNYFGVALEAVSSGCELVSIILQNGQVAADNTP
jgi:predicted RecA/RadA family phage recombinase